MNIVSLFAGCGGLDLGFERAGFSVVWANEFDKSIQETYRLNHPNTVLNNMDIRTLNGNDIPDCDGIIGGPPCQAWSEGGKRLGLDDPRGQLFLDYIRIVNDKRPNFFVIENVQGILDEKHKEALSGFLTLLRNAGYRISYELLNAADYNIPQDRFRVFFIGIRKDLPNKFVFPDAICSSPITLRQAIGDITELPRFFNNEYIADDHPLRMNHDVYIGSYDAKYMSRNRVRGWDEVSFTMQAQARNAPQHPQAPKMTFVSPYKRIFAKGYESMYRRLSVRECARIQTFPDNFKFIYHNVKDGYKMVGNAVPPRLAWYIAVQLKKAFKDIMSISTEEQKQTNSSTKNISIQDIADKYPKYIVNHTDVQIRGDISHPQAEKRVLIGLVKPENAESYSTKSSHIYYTGKKFPSTVHLNELYYFMPYIKGRGFRDLYMIKVVRVGTKHEVQPECLDNDIRLLFEIEYIKQLFEDYKPIHLNIWRTFTDTTMERILNLDDVD
jgi:DNA (cytosine-5)-methyltransferase 1